MRETADNSTFLGPVFIIGMPRSGTKLLRNLMNQHSRIGIPEIETNFLPYWAANWHRFADLSNREAFTKFYREMSCLSYFLYMKNNNRLINENIWYQSCKGFSMDKVFEALIRHDAEVDPNSLRIWGDKSPPYINLMPFLKKHFPSARFIHLIRDVRDYCLSINKAWGKHMIRAAQRWTDDVGKAIDDGKVLNDSYFELKYEQLIAAPVDSLQRVCNFLNIAYEPRMTKLLKSAENLGDAKGWDQIKQDNTEKYRRLMDKDLQYRIESIAAPVLVRCGYPVNYVGRTKRVNPVAMQYYKMIDAIKLLKFDISDRGLADVIKMNKARFIKHVIS